MAVVIRLSRAGRVHLPYYHIGVYNSRTRRDGRPVEELGFYNPKSDKESVRIDMDRARYWISVGAKPSATVATILKGQGMQSSEWMPARKKAVAKPAAKKSAKKAVKKPAAAAGAPTRKRKARTATSKARGEKAKKA
ncbi:MAG: 30S ribosomal protein S16 [Planctomycetes bacterium]|nr:30S ribosomal protein S16 [Planctomycetota bacterium]